MSRISTYPPPETSIDSDTSSEDAAGHLIDIRAGDTSRVNPDLVVEARDIKASDIGRVEPVRADT